MKVFRGISAISKKYSGAVIAIGVFDGLHLGHQKLIRQAVAAARTRRVPVVAMTFDPHPVHVLRPENHLPLIISLPYRLQLLASLGVDATVVISFTRSFSTLAPGKFIQNYLVKPFSPTLIAVGDDFRFGQNREGSIENFKILGEKFGFAVLSLSTRQQGRKKYSSTRVRDLITAGQLREAAKILGRPVALWGIVRVGDRRGKSLGFPTINLIPTDELLPRSGVYVARVHHKNKIYHGMANVGVRPSFHKQERVNVEVNIFNFRKNVYGEEVVVEFLSKIRDELYFPSKEALVKQLKKDECFSRKWFSSHKSF